jgi:3-isopropylmalate dehydrogenase
MSSWSESIEGRHRRRLPAEGPATVGVLRGEGIGPEVLDAATLVLSAVGAARGRDFRLRYGPAPSTRGPIGPVLTDEVADFCRDMFASGGAILAGPHSGRWVYELRRRFDLYCKISPLRPPAEIDEIEGPIRPRQLSGVDVLIVREQSGGIYQGRWSETDASPEGQVAEHSFSYTRREVQRIVAVATALASRRSGRLAVTVKQGGIPSISSLWQSCAEETAGRMGVAWEALDVDFAVYRLLHDPCSLDVVVAPNLFGDVLSDAGAALLGSRGLGYGGSFDAGRAAVYQTNHGAALDLAESDRANPVGQIFSVAMMLRESFGLAREAELIEDAVATVWRQGWRTEDLAEPGCRVIGTKEIGERVADAVGALARRGVAPAPEPA